MTVSVTALTLLQNNLVEEIVHGNPETPEIVSLLARMPHGMKGACSQWVGRSHMDRFSQVVLERTMELVIEAMQPVDPRVADCVNTVQRYFEEPTDNEKELQDAVKRLLEVAREKRQFLIAARLSSIVTRLGVA